MLMRTYAFSLLLALLLCPFAAVAQDEAPADIESYVLGLNEQCPFDFGDGLALKSFVVNGDTLGVVYQVPATLGAFLPLLTGDDDRARNLWLRELSRECGQWDGFVERVVASGRPMAIYFKAKGKEIAATLVYTPAFLQDLACPGERDEE